MGANVNPYEYVYVRWWTCGLLGVARIRGRRLEPAEAYDRRMVSRDLAAALACLLLVAGCGRSGPLTGNPADDDDDDDGSTPACGLVAFDGGSADPYGVYVSPAGSNSNPGSIAAPLLTLSSGIAMARANGTSSVYLAEGTYAESVEVSGVMDALRIRGGYTADFTSRDLALHPVVLDGGPSALRLLDLGGTVLLEGLEIRSASGTTASEASMTSHTVFVRQVALLEVVCSTLVAGDGANGPDGTAATPAAATIAGAAAGDGTATTGGTAGTGARCSLDPGNASRGGVGSKGGDDDGTGASSSGNAGVGSPGFPAAERAVPGSRWRPKAWTAETA